MKDAHRKWFRAKGKAFEVWLKLAAAYLVWKDTASYRIFFQIMKLLIQAAASVFFKMLFERLFT